MKWQCAGEEQEILEGIRCHFKTMDKNRMMARWWVSTTAHNSGTHGKDAQIPLGHR
jgi:hypothetical protein